MLKVVTVWNLMRPDEEFPDTVDGIELRGYNPDVFLTGEFATRISEERIQPLSVGDIADKYCPVGRDLYYRKGAMRPGGQRGRGRSTWGRVAGNAVEAYLRSLLDVEHESSAGPSGGATFSELRLAGTRRLDDFKLSHEQMVDDLSESERGAEGGKEGDTDWFLMLLKQNGIVELASRLFHSSARENGCVDYSDLSVNCVINPTPQQIGLSSQVVADFMVSGSAMVGDVKTGTEFKPFHQLTCAGYALAYENQLGVRGNMDWGVVYFLPTRNPSALVRPLTFAQVYIFPIDDQIRDWFVHKRDEAYVLVSRGEPPALPSGGDKRHCPHCAFRDQCVSEGLDLGTS